MIVSAKAARGIRRSFYRCLWLTLSLFAAMPQSHAATTKPTIALPRQIPITLSHIAQVRNLNPGQALRHIPVQLQGVITAMPGYRNSFFFEDSTSGISVDRTDGAQVHLGDQVIVSGTTGPGLFAPVVLASHVRVIGRSPPPHAPRRTLEDLFGGMQDSQWIELRGVVRSVSRSQLFGRPIMLVVLELDGGFVNLQLQEFAGIDFSRLIDSVVRVRGLCASSGNEKRQFIGSILLVPQHTDLTIEQSALQNPFASPARPIGDVLKLGRWQHRVKVSGTVTYQIPGHAIYLQDGDDGIRVQTDSPGIAVPGTRVDAVGFPAMQAYAPVLEDGQFHIVGSGTPIVPKSIEVASVITFRDGGNRAAYDQQLVQLTATLVEDHIQADRHVWILRRGDERRGHPDIDPDTDQQNNQQTNRQTDEFEALLPISHSSAQPPPIPAGSLLRLTGICNIKVGSTLNPVSFELLLRTPDDIVVVERGPWWTRNRSLALLAILAGVTALAFLWVAALRHRVERQTSAIRASEERYRYLSEHDALTGLLNRRAILLALDRQLDLGRRENKSLTIALCDIDHFKLVNDLHGHLAGDAALRRFAETVTACMRPYDSAGRYGGEEFLFVLSGIPPNDAQERLQKLHHSITNLAVRDQATQFQITCSLGAIVIEDCCNAMDAQSAIAAADRALYQAKEAGRNRIEVIEQQPTALNPRVPASAR